MSSITDIQAMDEINAVIKATWTADAPGIVGTANELRFQSLEKKDPPSPKIFWGRVSQQVVSQLLASMADETTFGQNKRRYETIGLVFVQIFGPKSVRNAFRLGTRLASAVRDGLSGHGTSGSVEFAAMRVQALPDDGESYRWNVVAEFSYDTIR